MSTKTVKKRIALAAVSTIVAGLLSSLSTPAANALVSTGYIPEILMIATTADGDGTVATNIGPTADQNFSQIGWLADTRTSSLTTTGGVYTASAGATGQAIVGAKLAFFCYR